MCITRNLSSIFVTLLLPAAIIMLSSCNKKTASEMGGMVFIPAGKFIMGSSDVDTSGLAKEFGSSQKIFFENEKPVRKIFLDGFYIDKFEATNRDYNLYTAASGSAPPPHWKNKTYPSARSLHPVFNVSWFDAQAYCTLRGKRLPTEEEWEKAARGPNGNRYPWGNEFDEKKSNLEKGDTVPVGSVPEDRSYYGVYDMGGNLMEWTSSWYEPYPGSSFKLKEYGKKYKVARGSSGNVVGHYHLIKIFSRSSFRHFNFPNAKTSDFGFRCVKSKD